MVRRTAMFALLVATGGTAQVPTPASHFGFEIGADRKLADWPQLTSYFEKLARTSPRVKVDTIGRTTMGAPFVMLTVTSPENQARLRELQDIQLRLSDPRRVTGEADLQRLFDAGRTVVLITHGIHATEVGGSQSAARLLYKLASSNDPKTREILDNVILLDIPSLNPDGLQWVVDWYRKTVGTPSEGTEPPWLYQFYVGHDNNRDWYAFTQKETVATIQRAHNAWHPEIVHDIHQMGNTAARIFFPPYIDPVEPNVDPGLIASVNQLGAWMAAELTAAGKAGAVINGIYDAWTPARSYQHYHGGARILSETASAQLASPIQQSKDAIRGGREYDASQRSWKFPLLWEGGRWGLPEIVDYQEAGALALLTNAARNRRYWLENFYNVNKRAVDGWRQWPVAWVIPADQPNKSGLAYVLRILTMGDVEVHPAAESFTAGGRTFPAGSYVIPMNQPYASFAQTMLEVQKYPDLREYPGGPPKRPYDVTAHTLPMLMNVEAVAVEQWGQNAARASGDGAARRHEGAPQLRAKLPVQSFAFELPAELKGRSAPRMALYKGWRESMESGWTRWTLDQHGLVYDTIKDARIRAGNLRRNYDVILIQTHTPAALRQGNSAERYAAEYAGGLGDAGVAALKTFVEEGGRLIVIEDATEFAIDLFGLPVKNAIAGVRNTEFYVPGSILKVDLDNTQPIARGMKATTPVWFSDASRAFDVTDPNVRVVARYASGTPALSGWILGPEKLAGKPALLEAKVGRGSVVLFGFQPDYRAQTVATWPLLFNALTNR
ncbi:MAG: M14 family zinc carboxypeptidase [Longimicrobiales bacterium]